MNPRLLKQLKRFEVFYLPIVATLSIAIFVRLIHYLATTGGNCPSNDDFVFLELLAKMSQAGYDWNSYFSDSFINGHCFAIGQMFFYCFANYFSLNQYFGCVLGAILAALRVIIFQNLLFEKSETWQKSLGLLFLSALTFSSSQIAILTHATFAVTWEFSLLMAALALWSFEKVEGKKGTAISCLCIVLSCWTIGIGISVIPVIWLSLIFSKKRNFQNISILLIGTMVTLSPYFVQLYAGSKLSKPLSSHVCRSLDLNIFLNNIGRCFTNGIGNNFYCTFESGLFGFVGIILLLLLCFQLNKNGFVSVAAKSSIRHAILIAAYGLLSMLMVTILRPFISPTYSLMAVWFWCAIAGLALFVLNFSIKPPFDKLGITIGIVPLLFMALMLGRTVRFDDKQFYLDNRAPVCEAILKHYHCAPNYAWAISSKIPGVSPSRIAIPLQKNQWSVFAINQEELLQGHFLFRTVKTYSTKDSAIFWIEGNRLHKYRTWKSYKRLNLCLKGKAKVEWNLEIPNNIKTISFHTRMISNKVATEKSSITVTSNQDNEILHCDNFGRCNFDLIKFKGKQIRILMSHTGDADKYCLFESPRIKLSIVSKGVEKAFTERADNVFEPKPLYTRDFYQVRKVDSRGLSATFYKPKTIAELKSFSFIAQSHLNEANSVCFVVSRINGKMEILEIPLFPDDKKHLYEVPARFFDSEPEIPCRSISLINRGAADILQLVQSISIDAAEKP